VRATELTSYEFARRETLEVCKVVFDEVVSKGGGPVQGRLLLQIEGKNVPEVVRRRKEPNRESACQFRSNDKIFQTENNWNS
jgi:hypothetical protein